MGRPAGRYVPVGAGVEACTNRSAVHLLVACLHLSYAKFCGGKVAGDAS